MISKENVLVVDVDGTLCSIKTGDQTYMDVRPEPLMVEKLRAMAKQNWRIILYSSRGMRTYDGNTGALNAEVLPVMIAWLKQHEIPFDEIHLGKPWPGRNGFYVDDRSVRPREFLEKSLSELESLCSQDRVT